jgi:D-cysteine desulfhydrase
VIGYYLLERLKLPHAYFIFAGGSNVAGTIGYVDAAFELKAQIKRAEMPEPAVIICALGSGGTLCGLWLGIQLAGLNTKVIGVRVSESHLGPFQACTPGTVKKLMTDTYKFLRRKIHKLPNIEITPPQILQDYIGDGYGFPTPEGNTAYHRAKESENIVLDPTYTAKTFAAVLDYCEGPGKKSGPILYWNTHNSIDLSNQAASVDYRKLPKSLQRFIEQKAITI